MSRTQTPEQPQLLPTEPKRRRSKKKAPTPIAGRVEDPRQIELIPDLPRLREFPDDDEQHDQQGA